MVSTQCQAAGIKTAEARLLAASTVGTQASRRRAVAGRLEAARRMHALCPGGTHCDCQCVVPDVAVAG